jgi:Ser-tRNA(Ala) deacylase AlaX
MNDTTSLLLATVILSVGGLGLVMYKNYSPDKGNNEKNDDSLFDFDLRSFFGNSDEDNEENEENEVNEENENVYNEYEEPEVYETPKKKRGSKTKSVRKPAGTKRRY